MESVNVVITRSISDQALEKITGISPKLKVTSTSALFSGEQKGDAAAKEKLSALLTDAEIYCGLYPPKDLIARAPRLKWIQVTTAGVDQFVTPEYVKSPVVVTKGGGSTNMTAVAEFTLGVILMFAKQAPLLFQAKQKKEWKGSRSAYLRSETVGIIGLGRIGREVARLSKAFGMRTLGMDPQRTKPPRYVDELIAPDQMTRLLSESDFVTLHCALVPETNKLIGEAALRSMKPGAYLINFGRAKLVDEEAVIRALEEKRIAGFAGDHFMTEPLPATSKLWELPNVIILPVRSSMVQGGSSDVEAWELFSENLKRYLKGKSLINLVDKKRGF